MSSERTEMLDRPAWILVVEDDPQIRQVVCWVLQDEGFEVEAAGDGGEAIELAAGRRPSLVVLDIGLPKTDGYGVADKLRQLWDRPPPILVVTADGRAAEKAQRVGAYAFLQKPFDADELLVAVRKGLAGG